MKKLYFCLMAVLAFATLTFAQTPEEILARMDKAMAAAEKKGMSMAMDLKIPIIGTTTAMMYAIGDRTKTETTMLGHKIITYSDGTSEWEYDTVDNKITITSVKPGGDSSEAELFSSITDGYDVTIKKETADAWYLQCKKSKTNTEKEDPDKMDLVVSKKTDMPISLTTKVSGIKITLRDVKLGVTEEEMYFNPDDYPDAKIVDERK